MSKGFKFVPFSKKQKRVLTWWMDSSPVRDRDIIFCDGSIRAGKTLTTSMSFVLWAHRTFKEDHLFGLAGKTIGSFKQNVLRDLIRVLEGLGFEVTYKNNAKLLIVESEENRSVFEVFGGKDEGSQDLIQGRTLAGMFFDEATLMPRSFIDQAITPLSGWNKRPETYRRHKESL